MVRFRCMKDQFLSLGYVRKQWCQRCVLFFISLLIQVLFVRWYWLKSLQVLTALCRLLVVIHLLVLQLDKHFIEPNPHF